jgi:ABC-2 type transport system permease protein
LLWPVFLFWQLFPLMATAFTRNLESASLLRFPLSYRSYFLIRLAYGSLDAATAVASLWLLGITIGIGAAQPRLPPWAAFVLFAFAIVNLLLARTAFAWLERWLAQRRTREIMGVLFFLCILSLQLVGPLIGFYGHKSNSETRFVGKELSKVQKALPPGLAAAAIAETARGNYWSGLLSFLLLGTYGVTFLWLLNLRLRAEYRRKSQRIGPAQIFARGTSALHPSWNVPGCRGLSPRVREGTTLPEPQRAMLFTLVVPLFMLLVFEVGTKPGPVRARARADVSAGRILTAPPGQSFVQQFWSRRQRRAVLFFFFCSLPSNHGREESGTRGDFPPGGCAGVAGHQSALPGAVDQGYARHYRGHSVCPAP